MVHPQVVDGGEGQIHMVARKKLNKQLQTADKGWSGLGLGLEANSSPLFKKTSML
jgi:hypothetical protein